MKTNFFKKILLLAVCASWVGNSYALSDTTLNERSVWLDLQTSVTVTGTVSAEDGSPLPGVNIVEKGTSNGVVSDFDGNFSITVSNQSSVLVFSSLGYATQEVKVEDSTVLDITLSEDSQALDEVVVIGYGTVQKRDLTGSVATVSQNELQQLPIVTTEQGLQGRVAGVQVSQTSGAPGGALSVRIRGNNSVQFGNDPLYVIDGFPLDASFESGNIGASSNFGGNQGTSPLAFLNPNDIESVSILKDASATAIYGARGANGVVIINTKKGRDGKTKISLDTYAGIQNITKKIDLLNAEEWATGARTFWQNFADARNRQDLLSRAFTPEEIANLGEGTNWQDEVYRSALIQSHNLSISGGSENTRFLMSGSYFNQEGIVIESQYKRGSVRLNVDHNVSDRFKVGINFTSSFIVDDAIPQSTAGFTQSNPIHGALYMAPVWPVRNENGNFFSQADEFFTGSGIFSSLQLQNPVELANKYEYEKTNNRTLANTYFQYDISKNLKAKVTLGADVSNVRVSTFLPSDLIVAQGTNGSASISSRQAFNWVNENTLNYIKTFGESHNFDALVGFSVQQDLSDLSVASTQDFFSNTNGFNNLSAGNSPQPPFSQSNEWALTSYIARLNYNFAQKYFFTVSARYDGSSRFGPDNKYGFFPSAAASWNISRENFLKDSDVISNLKLRASYGRTGNQEIPLYQSIQTFSTAGQYVFGDNFTTSIGPSGLANDDIKWENTDQFDVGLDMGFLAGRLNFTADYYYKETTDLLLSVPIARQGGFTSTIQNVGSVENKGLELALDAIVFDNDFKWNLSGNISFNRNKVLKLADADRFFGPTVSTHLIRQNGGAATVIAEGQPLGVFWGNIFDGIWQTQEEYDNGHMAGFGASGPGFENLRDIDGNGVFEEGLDEGVIGDPNPDYEFGINSNFSYKNLDLSLFLYGKQGFDILNMNLIEGLTQVHNLNGVQALNNAWTGPGTSNTVQKIDRPLARNGEFPNRVTTQYIEDGSFVRLRNVTLGYNLPLNRVNSLLTKARIYIAGENLFTITDYSGYDPEVSSLGNTSIAQSIDLNAYPIARTIRLGVQLEF